MSTLRSIARSLLLLVPVSALASTCSAAPIDAPNEGESGSVAEAVVDVTCGGRFPTAEPPYARRPDGCSSWSNNPAQVRDSWGSADFRSTCNDHDRCYYTVGANVDDCNRAFCDGVERACKHAYCAEKWGVRVCEPVTYGSCMAIAATYCEAVRAVAAGVYGEAQTRQHDWEACVAEQSAPPPPPGCKNGKAEGARWTELRAGTRCVDVHYRCTAQEIVQTGITFRRGCVEP